MDRLLISKYFSDQCSEEELEQVLDWFQTQEGRVYLEGQIEIDCRRVLEGKKSTLQTMKAQEKIFSRIQKDIKGRNSFNEQNQTSDLE